MTQPGRGPLFRRGVLPVVTRQVQLGQVEQRVPPVQFQVPVGDLGPGLERGQVRLVVWVRLRRPGLPGAVQPDQAVPYSGRGQILDPAVVLMAPGELADVGDVQIADSPDPGGEFIHRPGRYRAWPPPVTDPRPPCPGRP